MTFSTSITYTLPPSTSNLVNIEVRWFMSLFAWRSKEIRISRGRSKPALVFSYFLDCKWDSGTLRILCGAFWHSCAPRSAHTQLFEVFLRVQIWLANRLVHVDYCPINYALLKSESQALQNSTRTTKYKKWSKDAMKGSRKFF